MERVAMMVLCGDRRQLESEDEAMTMAGERYQSCDDNGSLGRSIRCGTSPMVDLAATIHGIARLDDATIGGAP